MLIFKSNINNFMRLHLIRILFTSNQIMLISNKKYAHSENELTSNWIDDLTLNLTLNDFLQRWSSSKSHANCDLSVFSLIASISIYFSSFRSRISNVEIIYSITSLSFSRSFSSFFFLSTHYDIYNFDNNLFKHFTHESMKSHNSSITERNVWNVEWKIFTNCMFACFIMKSSLKQKIHVANTRYNQIHMKKMHNQNTRRRNFDWKKRR